MCIIVTFFNLMIAAVSLYALGIVAFLVSKLIPRFSIPLNVLSLYIVMVSVWAVYTVLSFFLPLPLVLNG